MSKELAIQDTGDKTPPWTLFLRGLLSPLRAVRFLLQAKGIRRYAVLPFLINLLAFLLGFLALVVWILPGLNLEQYAPGWSGNFGIWVLTTFKWLIGLVLFLVLFIYGFSASYDVYY